MRYLAARSALTRQLSQHGQSVTLQRLSSPSLTVANTVTLRAHIVDFKPEEILATPGLQSGASRVIVAAKDLEAVSWPGLPMKGDVVLVGSRKRKVLFAWAGPYIEDQLVRVEMAVQ